MSMPCLHSASVLTIVPSASIRASAKNSSGCCDQTFSRVSLMASCTQHRWGDSNRRQKSPAVVDEGEVVQVLDRGPYRERIEQTELPPDCGLISPVQTVVELTGCGVRSES